MAKPFVRVKWLDAEDYQVSGWASEEEANQFNAKACESISFGFLVSKSRLYITIAADFIPPETYGRLMKVPKRMVKSIVEIPLPED